MGKYPSSTSQTTTVQMSPEQKWLFDLARPGIKSWAAGTPDRYPGSTIAGFDPLQTEGQNAAVDAARGQMSNVVGQAADANNFFLGDIWNPSTNPYLEQAIGAATRPITEAYNEQVLPGIRDQFMSAGQEFGGSRRGIAEGVAGGKYLNSVGDTASKLVQDQYSNNLNASLKALALAPTTAQALTLPAQTISGVGDIRQKLAQALLGEDVSNFNYDENAPFLQSQELLSLIGGLPGGSATSTAQLQQPPWWQQALGYGSTALSLGSALGGSGGIASLLPFLAL